MAKTMAQQLGDAVEAFTAPYQYALRTKAGCECVAHVLQGLTELDPLATVTSVDGISAFDLISRKAMLEGLMRVDGGSSALPFVRLFYGSPSEYLWEDATGTVHTIPQGEGGEQGDPLMPLLFSVGQHSSLEAVGAQLRRGEHLLAFLDDIHMVTRPERVGAVHACLGDELQTRASIRIHGGKTKIWNQAGERPPICDVLERIAQQNNPRARVWRGSEVPTAQQGIKVLGTPLGHPDFVRQHLRDVSEEHERFLTRIPLVRDVQSAWLLLLHCAQARANFLLRAVRPEAVEEFATRHDRGLWWCLAQILGVNLEQCEVGMQEAATFPLVLGGLGLRSAIRTRYSAFWASWADCIPMVGARHPEVAAQLVVQLEGHPATPCLGAAAAAARALTGIMNFEPPSWRSVLLGARPHHGHQTPSSQAPSDKDGNMKLHPGSRKISKLHCWTGCQTVPRHP